MPLDLGVRVGMNPNAARQVHSQCRTVKVRLRVKGCRVNRACPSGAQLIYQATVAARADQGLAVQSTRVIGVLDRSVLQQGRSVRGHR